MPKFAEFFELGKEFAKVPIFHAFSPQNVLPLLDTRRVPTI